MENSATEPSGTSEKKKASRGGWTAAIFIIFVEVAEQFTSIGVGGNLITYLTNVLHFPTASAAKIVNTWNGISATFPLLGAFVADSLLGRFNTIILSSALYLLGMVLLTLAVSVIPVANRKAVFFIALYTLSVGSGGHKPCVQTFAADQFDEGTEEDRKVKSSFFNWWYLGLVVGSSVAIFVVIYLQDNVSWTLSFVILAVVLAAALALFLLGTKKYRRQGPMGSPFTSVAQVLVAAGRKWRIDTTRHGWLVYPREEGHGVAEAAAAGYRPRPLAPTSEFRILDKATIIDDVDESRKTRDPWRLCTVDQVEQVKILLRLIPIWLCCLMFGVVQAQLHTFFTKQGSTMIRSIGSSFRLPPASLQGIVGFTILIAIPLYDRLFVPGARKLTSIPTGITVLQRIGIGLFLSILNMAVSALVEAKRVGVAKDHRLLDSPKAPVPMAVWWLLPQYIICGLSDAFAVVGMQELFYDQMPETMRSLGAAVYISGLGVGSFLSTAVICVLQAVTSRRGDEWLGNNLNRAKLDRFYWVLAVMSAVNLCVYVWIARGYVYKKVEVDDDGGPKDTEMGNNVTGRCEMDKP